MLFHVWYKNNLKPISVSLHFTNSPHLCFGFSDCELKLGYIPGFIEACLYKPANVDRCQFWLYVYVNCGCALPWPY